MKLKHIISALSLVTVLSSCEVYESPERTTNTRPEVAYYEDMYDPIADEGQYWHPELKVVPKRYVTCVHIANHNLANSLVESDPNVGLQSHLTAQSAAGIINRSVEKGTNPAQWGVWLRDEANLLSYRYSKQALEGMGMTEVGLCVAHQVATAYGELRPLFDGYVLTDVVNKPESGVVAAVASHVYNSVIVDVRDEQTYVNAGFTKKYDARDKTTADAWREFKDKCSNKALVIMPVNTGQLREFAITHDLFVLNLNKVYADPSKGQNIDVLDEVLAWLAPNAPVYGWEQGVGEDEFVNRVSKSGHVMVPYDWAYNTGMTSLNYSKRQNPASLAKVTNPQFINFESPKKKFVSFYMSDGDNVQWMMNRFDTEYFTQPEAKNVKMSFGMPVVNLSMMAPAQFDALMNLQKPEYSLIESLGGGYFYVDTYGVNTPNRMERLQSLAKGVASHMRQHRVKLLGLVAMDACSEQAKGAYKTYIEANDQLEGVVVIQYSPYAGGEGDIMWFTNSKGYDIPVVTVRYSIWNFGNRNTPREGTPTYIANRLNEESESPFSMVSVHAWSKFADTGDSQDELAENATGSVYGSAAAEMCARRLGDDTQVVNAEELIWRIRMHYRPEQTKDFLSKVF